MRAASPARELHPPVLHGTLAEIAATLGDRPHAKRGATVPEHPVRVLLVDDHTILRAGLKALLHPCADICVVGEAAGVDEALILARPGRTHGPGTASLLGIVLGPLNVFVFEPAHFIMERGMMRGVRDRAERDARRAG